MVCAKIRMTYSFAYRLFDGLRGFKPTTSKGGMFFVVLLDLKEFKGFENDEDFCAALFKEQSVALFPGSLFAAKQVSMFRVVLSHPLLNFIELEYRLKNFCKKYYA